MNRFSKIKRLPKNSSLQIQPIEKLLSFPDGEITDRSEITVITKKALVMADIHAPYHHKGAVTAAVRAGQILGVDTIILAGDLLDCHFLSDYVKDPNKRSFPEEVALLKVFLTQLREAFPTQQILYMLGNHEERFQRFVYTKTKELYGLAGMELENILELDSFNIQLVKDKRRIKIGELNILHGHEYQNLGSGVNPAWSLFKRAKTYAMMGHCHRKSEHQENTLNGKPIVTYSIGCLCDLSPDYFPYNNWVHGFAIVDLHDDGHFHVTNHYIGKDGKVY